MKRLKAFLSALLLLLSLAPCLSVRASQETEDPIIMVSLGDSYSSGEGIPDFYGQELSVKEKVDNDDWLAHRSQYSWAGRLKLPGVSGTMKDHRGVNWYFAASSGAITYHLNNSQTKSYSVWVSQLGTLGATLKGSKKLSPQLDVFDAIPENTVDYVTMTMGGNDVGFQNVITSCAIGSTYLHISGLEDQLNAAWTEFYAVDGTGDKLKQAYLDVADKAGEQAKLLIVGYPRLLDEDGKGLVISKQEARLVNDSVSIFNGELERIVNALSKNGINIQFVSVEEEFKGHGAYSDDPYINEIILAPQSQDLKNQPPSAYSVHPNSKGAAAYARAVQAAIDETALAYSDAAETWKLIREYDFYDFLMRMPELSISHPNTSTLIFYPQYSKITEKDGVYEMPCEIARMIEIDPEVKTGTKLTVCLDYYAKKFLKLTKQSDGSFTDSDGRRYSTDMIRGRCYLKYKDSSEDYPYQIFYRGTVQVKSTAHAGYFMHPEAAIDTIRELEGRYSWFNGLAFDESGIVEDIIWYGD